MKKLSLLFLIIFLATSLSFAEENQPRYHKMDVPYISQLHPIRAVVGCEATSLLMGMKYKGVASEISLKDFLEYMPKTATNPAKGFAGSPYVPSEKIRTTIYPKPLTDYANTYMQDIARDISGSELDMIKEELLSDNPVVVYATMWWNKPYYRQFNIEGENQWLLRNNHVILLAGYDEANNKFYVADPYNKNNPRSEYFYWIDEAKLKPIYDERKWAVAVGSLPALYKAPESIEDFNEDSFVEKTFGNHSYLGVVLEDKNYFDIEDILKKEINHDFIYVHENRSATIKSETSTLVLNFINNTLYIGNTKIDSLIGDRITLDEKLYFEENDVKKLINILEKSHGDVSSVPLAPFFYLGH